MISMIFVGNFPVSAVRNVFESNLKRIDRKNESILFNVVSKKTFADGWEEILFWLANFLSKLTR